LVSYGHPAVSIRAASGAPRAVVLVLHGGAEHGIARTRPWHLAYLRMLPLAKAIHRAAAEYDVEVRLMRNRVDGWNEPELDPVRDARWALEQIRTERRGLPVVLVGHSMGGRVALRVADDPSVIGVCALAPWTPSDEPVASVRGRSVLIVHGALDRTINPADSYSFASRAEPGTARLARFEVTREGHAMVRRARVWTRLVTAFALDVLAGSATGPLASAWTERRDERLRIPV
jgi:dienelactone hydrolase